MSSKSVSHVSENLSMLFVDGKLVCEPQNNVFADEAKDVVSKLEKLKKIGDMFNDIEVSSYVSKLIVK
ncbi:MAG: hypothetical protein COA79_06490 [Planctomycetota bacterium]|nr:MAG: hypothetical protein COA79_06490 [Planctomycetota bacterium]